MKKLKWSYFFKDNEYYFVYSDPNNLYSAITSLQILTGELSTVGFDHYSKQGYDKLGSLAGRPCTRRAHYFWTGEICLKCEQYFPNCTEAIVSCAFCEIN